MARSSTTFRTGHRKVGGRRTGALNKKTVILQELRIIESLDGGLVQILNEIGLVKWFKGLRPAHQVRLVVAAMESESRSNSIESDQLASLLHHFELNESIVSAERDLMVDKRGRCPNSCEDSSEEGSTWDGGVEPAPGDSTSSDLQRPGDAHQGTRPACRR